MARTAIGSPAKPKKKKKKLPAWTKQKSGSVANVFNSLDKEKKRGSEEINRIDRKFRPPGKPTTDDKKNVFNNLKGKKTAHPLKKATTGIKFTQNPADYTPTGSLEVKNKKYKSRVNNILGR